MASTKKISQPFTPRKRPFDDEYEVGTAKMRRTVIERRPLKDVSNGAGSNLGKMISHDKVQSAAEKINIQPNGPAIMGNKPSGSRPAGSGITADLNQGKRIPFVGSLKPNRPVGSKPFGPRPTGKVKFWDPTKEPKVTITGISQARRQKIKEVLNKFDEVHRQLSLENMSKPRGERIPNWRVPKEAANIVKQNMKWMDAQKTLGPVCGVQVGDKFRYRPLLQMVGLHCQPQFGIDYTKIEGKKVAISIVDSDRYSNKQESCDVLLYCGQGGVSFLGGKPVTPEDQKLERGNLALKNSMRERTPVRVIRRLKWGGKDSEVFVYDGLYTVEKCTQKKGSQGKMVFMFELHRVAGQPELNKMLNENRY